MNLNCHEARPLLDSYLTNELQVETLHAVNQHLTGCAACRTALASRERTRAAVNSTVRGFVPDEAFTLQIRDAVRAEAATRGHLPWRWAIAALAASLLLLFGWRQWRLDTAQILARLALGKGDHILCARGGFFPDTPPTPAQMREQVGAAYVPLVQAVLDRSPGYVVREGHLCHWQDREFVHFILERQNRLVSVMLTRKHSPEEVFPRHALLSAMRAGGHAVYTTADNGMAIAGLDTGSHLAFVVSERGPAEGTALLAALAPSLALLAPQP
ncbi:MAG: zf-HC2 domain-containing protein [Bryobacteraceae bacterium]|nr:zf-HC2 domain-containing protein [Bryobacteraceae bacterium]